MGLSSRSCPRKVMRCEILAQWSSLSRPLQSFAGPCQISFGASALTGKVQKLGLPEDLFVQRIRYY